MARSLSQTLISSILSKSSPPYAPSSRFVNQRSGSNLSEKGSVIEVELESETDAEGLGIRRLEDAIHGIIVKRSAPDWLPFLPGSSYWVPPRKRPYEFVQLVEKLTNPLTVEENLSRSSVRGFPSSSYFVDVSHFSVAASLSLSTLQNIAVQVVRYLEVSASRTPFWCTCAS